MCKALIYSVCWSWTPAFEQLAIWFPVSIPVHHLGSRGIEGSGCFSSRVRCCLRAGEVLKGMTVPYPALPPFLSCLWYVRKQAYASSRIWCGHNRLAGLYQEMLGSLPTLPELLGVADGIANCRQIAVLFFMCCFGLLAGDQAGGEWASCGLWCCHQNLVFNDFSSADHLRLAAASVGEWAFPSPALKQKQLSYRTREWQVVERNPALEFLLPVHFGAIRVGWKFQGVSSFIVSTSAFQQTRPVRPLASTVRLHRSLGRWTGLLLLLGQWPEVLNWGWVSWVLFLLLFATLTLCNPYSFWGSFSLAGWIVYPF